MRQIITKSSRVISYAEGKKGKYDAQKNLLDYCKVGWTLNAMCGNKPSDLNCHLPYKSTFI